MVNPNYGQKDADGEPTFGSTVKKLNEFRKFTKLQLLDLSSNQLIEFPSCVKDAPLLKILRLIHNRINKIPEDFF